MARSAGRRSRFRAQQRCDSASELIMVADNRSTTLCAATKTRRNRQIARIWRIQRVEIPRRPAHMRHVLAEPVADGLPLVPEVGHTWIGHAIAVPAVATV